LGEADARKANSAAARKILDAMDNATQPDLLRLHVDAWKVVAGRLTRQELVDLLKRPASVGVARETVLHQLGQPLNRKFATLWDLLDWLEANDPGIDVLSPPKPPGA
jgi:hypothetical protein